MSYIGNEPIVSATRTITEIVATAGQTVFVANGGYTVGYIDVFVNGAQLQTSDFTATNGSSITLVSPATIGDDIRLVAWGTFGVASLNGSNLVDASVTAAKLASSSVTQAKVASGVAGTGPAFIVYSNANQAGLTANTSVKIAFNVEEFDTNSRFNNTAGTVGGIPAYSFLPNVAGYYQINLCVYITPDTASTNAIQPLLYRNGSSVAQGVFSSNTTTSGFVNTLSCLVYMNGTTDYLEFYIYGNTTSGAWTIRASAANTYANGFLARAA